MAGRFQPLRKPEKRKPSNTNLDNKEQSKSKKCAKKHSRSSPSTASQCSRFTSREVKPARIPTPKKPTRAQACGSPSKRENRLREDSARKETMPLLQDSRRSAVVALRRKVKISKCPNLSVQSERRLERASVFGTLPLRSKSNLDLSGSSKATTHIERTNSAPLRSIMHSSAQVSFERANVESFGTHTNNSPENTEDLLAAFAASDNEVATDDDATIVNSDDVLEGDDDTSSSDGEELVGRKPTAGTSELDRKGGDVDCELQRGRSLKFAEVTPTDNRQAAHIDQTSTKSSTVSSRQATGSDKLSTACVVTSERVSMKFSRKRVLPFDIRNQHAAKQAKKQKLEVHLGNTKTDRFDKAHANASAASFSSRTSTSTAKSSFAELLKSLQTSKRSRANNGEDQNSSFASKKRRRDEVSSTDPLVTREVCDLTKDDSSPRKSKFREVNAHSAHRESPVRVRGECASSTSLEDDSSPTSRQSNFHVTNAHTVSSSARRVAAIESQSSAHRAVATETPSSARRAVAIESQSSARVAVSDGSPSSARRRERAAQPRGECTSRSSFENSHRPTTRSSKARRDSTSRTRRPSKWQELDAMKRGSRRPLPFCDEPLSSVKATTKRSRSSVPSGQW